MRALQDGDRILVGRRSGCLPQFATSWTRSGATLQILPPRGEKRLLTPFPDPRSGQTSSLPRPKLIAALKQLGCDADGNLLRLIVAER